LQRSLKPKLVIGLAALAVGAFAGGAYAATQNSPSNTRQAFLDDVAKRLHVTPQQLSSALSGAFDDQLQSAVKNGQLTQAQADALKQRLKQHGAAPAIPFGPFGPFGPQFARPGLRGGFGPRGLAVPPGPPLAPRGPLAGAAKYLGLSDDQLFQQLAGGKSLAQIAASRGKTVAGLEQAMTDTMKSRLDQLVANKMITAAEEQKILSRWSARLSQVVNHKGFEFRRPFLRHFGRGPMPPMPKPGAAAPLPVPVPGAAAPLPVPVSGAASPVPVPAPTA
jgi:AraC-like DNA-binding protein